MLIALIEADFHIHSKFSQDSILSPRMIVKTALARGLSTIAVTDHGTLKGAKKVIREVSSKKELLVIPGIELKTNFCDVVGLFLQTEIKSHNFYEVVDEIRKQDGVVILPHPLKYDRDVLEEIVNHVDLIEGLNGRMSHAQNDKAQNLAILAGKPVIAGSDAHFFFEIGCVRTLFSDSQESLSDLKKLILKDERTLVGKESPYFVHALSFGVETFGRILDLLCYR
jgi:hypothetical protein